MKLINVKDPNKLMNVVNKCKGKVELIGPDIRVNLKSKIAQLVSLAELFSAEVELGEFEIVAYEPDDVLLLIEFLRGRVSGEVD